MESAAGPVAGASVPRDTGVNFGPGPVGAPLQVGAALASVLGSGGGGPSDALQMRPQGCGAEAARGPLCALHVRIPTDQGAAGAAAEECCSASREARQGAWPWRALAEGGVRRSLCRLALVSMAGGLVRHLFAHASAPPASRSPPSRALVSGPPACGKTSLLLQFALNCAAQDPSSFVTFLCKPHSLDHSPPCLSQGVDAESDAFARITIKYIHDDEDLRKYFAAFHVQRIFPRAVIIDDFYDLFNERSCAERFGHIRPRESAMVKTLALCYDAINFANDNGGRGAQCHLIVSDSHVGEAPRLRFIYQRWLPQILTIEGLDDSSFCVSLAGDEEMPGSKVVKAKYTLLQERLQLDYIEVHG